jgi:hypothetical protein
LGGEVVGGEMITVKTTRRELLQVAWDHRKSNRKYKQEILEGKRSGIFDSVIEKYEPKNLFEKVRCLLFGPPWVMKIHSIERPVGWKWPEEKE